MKKILFLLPFYAAIALANDEAHSFVDVDTDFHKIHRNLLQEDTVQDEEMAESGQESEEKMVTSPPPVYRGLAEPGEYKLGPKLYFDGKDFLMRLGAPIKATIFPGMQSGQDPDKKLSTVDLDVEAGSVKGSMIDSETFQVNIDWKSSTFGNDFKISTISIHMYFIKTKDEFIMKKLDVKGLTVNGKQMLTNPLEVKTKHGYKVAAPLGSSWCCYNPGMFQPAGGVENNPFRVGLTFPNMQLQVFKLSKVRFGPEWACDSFMTIGVWVGLLTTLLFASICVWGFSMLGNIQTMDRFDDPRGKTIHVPQTD